MFGTFILVLAYLTQTEETYKLSEDSAITLLIISASYAVGLALSNPIEFWSTGSLNPAISLATISYTTFSGNTSEMHYSWVYFTFPWIGSLLAVLVFELVFRKAMNAVAKVDEEQEEVQEEQAEISQPLVE